MYFVQLSLNNIHEIMETEIFWRIDLQFRGYAWSSGKKISHNNGMHFRAGNVTCNALNDDQAHALIHWDKHNKDII